MHFFSFFSNKLPIDTAQIEQTIADVERQTSAEVRVVVERKMAKSALAQQQANSSDEALALLRANQLFAELKMHETAERNGVLIYLAFKPHAIAVVGDSGIHQQVGQDFWQAVYQGIRTQCQAKQYTAAICEGIKQVGEQLAMHFPYHAEDRNELANEVVIK